MTTVQIIGIAVASLVVLLLVVALLLTRRRGKGPESDAQTGGSSFLDEAPQDTFAGLGRAEQPVEDVTLDPGVRREREAAAVAAAAAEQQTTHEPAAGGLGLDWEPDLSVTTQSPPPGPPAGRPQSSPAQPEPLADSRRTVPETELDDAATTGAMAAPAARSGQVRTTPSDTLQESGAQAAATQPARPAEGGPAAGDVAASESGSGGHLVPLSDIIVTTSSKLIDLQDAEVRRMLTDLVTFEIDQAAEFRRRGRTIDAVLQLTEAEKVSRGLGMNESAERIRTMMAEIEGSR